MQPSDSLCAEVSVHERSRHGNEEAGNGSLPTLKANAAGIDIGSAEHWVAVPIDRDDEHVRSFSALTHGLQARRLAPGL